MRGVPYHFCRPETDQNIIIASINQAQGLEGDAQLKLYLYIDDNFAFKTKSYPKGRNPYINLDIDM